MKTHKLFILVIFLSFSCLIYSKQSVIKPLNNKNKTVLIESGKNRIYYGIQKNDPSIILVKGPGKLTVRTRALMPKEKDKISYSVNYNIDGSEYIKINFQDVEASKKAKFDKNPESIPGSIKDIIIELGPGEHTLNFNNEDENTGIIARYLFSKVKEKKLTWVMLSPFASNEPVDLVTHENTVHYFRFSEKKPLKIKIIGPTILRVSTRFENHYTMKGRIDYRLQLKESGNIIHTYLLSSTFSDVTTYKDNATLVPGKAREFYIEVPAGKHTYMITPMDKDKNTILARVLFPKKDIKLEE